MKIVLKNNYINKNKILRIKIIFKTHLKILKINLKYFKFSNILLFYKNQRTILKTIFHYYFQTNLLDLEFQLSQ